MIRAGLFSDGVEAETHRLATRHVTDVDGHVRDFEHVRRIQASTRDP